MKNIRKAHLCIPILAMLLLGCRQSSTNQKGFQVREITENEDGKRVVGLQLDSLNIETQPRNVLKTHHAEHRLTPIYKVNFDKKTNRYFTGYNRFHHSWEDRDEENNWNGHFMPGFEALYGYNLVNVSHYNVRTAKQHLLFENPVLIRTLYYPALEKDTLNALPIQRDFYLVSAYDEDSNKDGFLDAKDLRHLYCFDINGDAKESLIPKNYSVMSSEYDAVNDYMYIFAKKDINQNGQMESDEPIHIFWIDLKNPQNYGRLYGSK